jgi:hypothetical protein
MQSAGFIAMSKRVRGRATVRFFEGRNWHLLLMWIAFSAAVCAQNGQEVPVGVAWQVNGLWHADGQTDPLHTGDLIEPGSLLAPVAGSPAHSITILLPDGQRILYECYLAADCARGFRVPMLYRKPDSFAVNMLWRIHAVLVTKSQESKTREHQGALPRDEAVAMLDTHAQAEATGLVAALPDGQYTYTERALGHEPARPIRKTFEKKGASVILDFPSPGLYELTIADRLNTPRIDLMIAAVKAPQGANIVDSFREAKALLQDWNGDYQGWPVHDFQRDYLESLMLDINPQVPQALSVAPSIQKNRPGEVKEPVFTPKPGVLHGDTAVSLRCDTPGATIYFTVDGSQPLASSQVYSAPIMVKGTALTIKAFAIAKGTAQSAVVTGIFRVGD